MAIQVKPVVNESYEPTANDDTILDVLKDGREEGQPWGRANPRFLIERTDLSKSTVEHSLRSLRKAGWIMRPSRGCYEFVTDPREEKDD
jgi:DNA-binding transcriptional ArsR family regulator